MSNITANIKGIRDVMRKDTGVDGDAQRISQMVWMLFMKIFADKEEEWDLTIEGYQSPIPENLKWQNWASDDEGLTGDALMEFVNNELFPTLQNLDISFSPQARIIRSVFDDTYNFMKNGTLFRQVINEIDKIDFNSSTERHVFNDLYETILKELQSAGSAGEFYTPRGVTQFMVDIINPQLGESVYDMACGTGGFLTCGIEHLRNQVKTAEDRDILQKSIRGIEKKPLPHLLCTTNLMLHGFDLPAVRRDNLLSKPYADWGKNDRVDIILMNPPFGGVEEDGTETNFPSKFRTKETADLFLALIIKMMKDGGRCAVVLPDGTLFGEGVKTRIKEDLMEKCNLHTIVRFLREYLTLIQVLRPTFYSLIKEHPQKMFGTMSIHILKDTKATTRVNLLQSKSLMQKKHGGITVKKTNTHGKYLLKRSRKEDIIWISRIPHQEADTLGTPEEILEQYRTTENKIGSIQDEIIKVLTEALS